MFRSGLVAQATGGNRHHRRADAECFCFPGAVDVVVVGATRTREAQTSFENNLLAGLIPHGRFSPEFLGLLGDQMYGTNTGDVRDTGWGDTFGRYGSPGGPGQTEPDLTPLTYQAVVLEAISQDMLLAGEFADRHLDKILAQSRQAAEGYGQGGDRGIPAALDRLEDGRLALLRTATLGPSWLSYDGGRVDPVMLRAATENAEVLLAHLAYLQATTGGHVSTPMQALYGEILHTYRDDMYRSVTTLTPETAALLDADGHVMADWPGAGKLWSQTNAATSGVELPQELWAALIREALRNGTTVPLLAADAEHAAGQLGPLTEGATRNPQTAPLPGGQLQDHLDPADLDNYRSERIDAFFTLAVDDVLRTLDTEAANNRGGRSVVFGGTGG